MRIRAPAPQLIRVLCVPMTERDWHELDAALHDVNNVDRAVAAADRIQREAGREDIPHLLHLLKDTSFFVREAAAWPLSDLGVTEALPELLAALHQGEREGHDNDGLTAALVDLAEARPQEAATVLNGIAASGKAHLREHAVWLLEFCQAKGDA